MSHVHHVLDCQSDHCSVSVPHYNLWHLRLQGGNATIH